MNEFAGLPLSVKFIVGRVKFRIDELVLGYRRRWIDDRSTIALALAQYEHGADQDVMARISLLLDAERFMVSELIEIAERSGDGEGDAERVWLYLFLAWLYDHRLSVDAYAIIDEMFAEFGYPETMEKFVTFMPVAEGEVAGVKAMDRQWKLFLDEEQQYFSGRRLKSPRSINER